MDKFENSDRARRQLFQRAERAWDLILNDEQMINLIENVSPEDDPVRKEFAQAYIRFRATALDDEAGNDEIQAAYLALRAVVFKLLARVQ